MEDAIELNRSAWNDIAERHKSVNADKIVANLKTTPTCYVDDVLKDELQKVLDENSNHATVAQFNCNNGREIISATKMGFSSGYGFDFSDEFIQQARFYADQSGAPCTFVNSDIYKIDNDFHGIADALFLTAGAMCWMPDLRHYFQKAATVLKDNGRLVLWETHPFLEMFKPDRNRLRDGDVDLRMHYPYFLNDPVLLDSGLDYYSNEIDDTHNMPLWYHHTLSAIFQAILDSDFAVEVFAEYEFDNSIGYRHVEEFVIRPPMSFILSAVKK